jgi:hypothetical protein
MTWIAFLPVLAIAIAVTRLLLWRTKPGQCRPPLWFMVSLMLMCMGMAWMLMEAVVYLNEDPVNWSRYGWPAVLLVLGLPGTAAGWSRETRRSWRSHARAMLTAWYGRDGTG